MARLVSSTGRRRPLFSGPINIGWRNMPEARGADPAETFTLSLGMSDGPGLELTRIEAEKLVRDLTEKLADPELLKAAGL